jgi:transposase-like protein
MKKNRKNYSPEEKVVILRRHLLDNVPVSTLCDEYQLQPTVFYRWQKELFEHGASAFRREKGRRQTDAHERRIAELEAKLLRKNEVLSELMEEHVQLKKEFGEF